jgi:hypothetical protein
MPTLDTSESCFIPHVIRQNFIIFMVLESESITGLTIYLVVFKPMSVGKVHIVERQEI